MTELRFCQCGKPVGHASVCNLGPDDGDQEVERIDRATEEQLTERAGKRWERVSRERDAERRQQRAEMTTIQLHRHALERIAKLSTVAAGNVEPSRGGGTQVGPPRQQELEDDPRWRERWEVIRHAFRRLHELLDEAEGLGAVAAKTLDTDEKNALILAEQGLSSVAVVEKLGRDIAGSPETVRRVRRAAGLTGADGTPLERPQHDHSRRVVIDDR